MCKYSPREGSWGLHIKAYTLFLTVVKHLSNRAPLCQSFPSSSCHFRQCFASPVCTDPERNWPTKCIISGIGTAKCRPTKQRGSDLDYPMVCFISCLETIEEEVFRFLLFWLQRSIENLFLVSRDRCHGLLHRQNCPQKQLQLTFPRFVVWFLGFVLGSDTDVLVWASPTAWKHLKIEQLLLHFLICRRGVFQSFLSSWNKTFCFPVELF